MHSSVQLVHFCVSWITTDDRWVFSMIYYTVNEVWKKLQTKCLLKTYKKQWKINYYGKHSTFKNHKFKSILLLLMHNKFYNQPMLQLYGNLLANFLNNISLYKSLYLIWITTGIEYAKNTQYPIVHTYSGKGMLILNLFPK